MPATYRAPDVRICGDCGRTLRDPESLARGYGPVCWRARHPPPPRVPASPSPARRRPDTHQLALSLEPQMPITRTFTRTQLDAWDLPGAFADDAPEILHRKQVDSRRWVSVHELIFRAPDDGKTYRLYYEQGLTEDQEDTDPWNGDREVMAEEVEQQTVTVTRWQPVRQPAT